VARPACSTFQTTPGIGRHCQYMRINAAHVNSTNVLRSTGLGTIRVHQRLKPGRAMIMCWTAKRPSSSALTSSAVPRGPTGPLLIVFGTTASATKPMA